MRSHHPTPLDRERPFGPDELFISTTDAKGLIAMSNAVFVRVSGYDRDDLVGSAHNIIRHPDMPRAVFALFWEELKAGRPVAAYVKNLAADGAYYWVMAIAVPVDGGYLSVRLKPSTPLFDRAREIYAKLVALERSIEGDEPRRRKEAIAESAARLPELLREAGFEDYGAFMRAALPAEVAAREAVVGDGAADLAAADAALAPAARRVVDACAAAHATLVALSGSIAGYEAAGDALAGKSTFVRELADQVRLFTLNALLPSARLADGAALGTVAVLVSGRAEQATPLIRGLGGDIDAASALLRDTGFRMAAAKLLTEMMMVFGHELADAEDQRDVERQLALLAHSVEEAVELVCTALGTVSERLQAVARHATGLGRELKIIHALEVNGRVESARATDTEHVKTLFVQIGRQAPQARKVDLRLDVDRRPCRAVAVEREDAPRHEVVAGLSDTAAAQPAALVLTA